MAKMASTNSSTTLYSFLLLLFGSFLMRSCVGFGTFGFDIHHRYSDPVKGILAVDGLPEKGSLQYYAAMTQRDRVVFSHGRGLAAAVSEPLTFYDGNETISSLGYLHYANVSVGTPSVWFFVALDTGSDLFWLPCDCGSQCVHGLATSSGQKIEFNIYSPNVSSTSEKMPCSSTSCPQRNQCLSTGISCPYEVQYLSSNTSSTGYLVEDLLHLTTDDTQAKAFDQQITLGCGQIQTGSFLDGAAPNGLFGLGMTNISVPSTLARELQIPNTFSMCFGSDGIGRISFGDKGSSDQAETPFNLMQPHPTYNISITQITVNGNNINIGFTAIVDSGTSFTYLSDPAYSVLSNNFNSQVSEKRHSSTSDIPFEYCYDLSPNQTQVEIPDISLVMKGGDHFNVTDPIVVVALSSTAYVYCLALVKTEDVNIIGQNFMTGYRIIFDRDREVLGWTPSNCYQDVDSNTLPVTNSSAVTPATAVNPEATAGGGNNSQIPAASASHHAPRLYSLTYALLLLVIIPFFAIV